MDADKDSSGSSTPSQFNPFSRSDELTIDPSTLELGSAFSRPAQDITEASNRFGGAQVGRWQVDGDVVALHHGTYNEQAALFLAFRFRYPDVMGASERIVRADIEITFQPEPRSSTTPRPIVVDHRPKKLTVNETPARVGESTGREYTFSMIPGQQPLQFELGTTTARKRELGFNQTFAITVQGDAKRSRDSIRKNGHDDTVLWRVTENGALKKGIPHEVHVAVVVTTKADSFIALVKTNAHMSSGIGRFGLLWTDELPLRVVRSERTAFGPAPRDTRFEQLTEEDWSPFAGVRGY